MADLSKLDRPLVEQWLREARVVFDECGECDGLHISALRSIDGAIDSRLFLERYGLLLTTELEIRPMALLAVSADLGRLNMEFPTLKIFLDIVDDATPQLVIAGVLVRICTLHENGCSGANEYLAQKREQDRQDNQGD